MHETAVVGIEESASANELMRFKHAPNQLEYTLPI